MKLFIQIKCIPGSPTGIAVILLKGCVSVTHMQVVRAAQWCHVPIHTIFPTPVLMLNASPKTPLWISLQGTQQNIFKKVLLLVFKSLHTELSWQKSVNPGNQIVIVSHTHPDTHTQTHTFKHSCPWAQSAAAQPISDMWVSGRSYSKLALLCPEGFVCVCAPGNHTGEKVQVFLFAK